MSADNETGRGNRVYKQRGSARRVSLAVGECERKGELRWGEQGRRPEPLDYGPRIEVRRLSNRIRRVQLG